MEILILCIALVVILIGAEVFTNALEHLGERLGISEGVTGSIFAAVGTALPETMVPIFAILSSSGSMEVRHEVGVGAILGAPLMLSTLAFALMAGFAANKRGWTGLFHPEMTGLNRDMTWFKLCLCTGSDRRAPAERLAGHTRQYQFIARDVVWVIFIGDDTGLSEFGRRRTCH